MRKGVVVYVTALAATTALFLLAPGLDLWASALFHHPGGGFFLAETGPVRFAYRAVPALVAAQVICIPFTVLLGWWRGRAVAGIDLKAGIFVLAVLALGPGLLVNTALKDHWGRARPTQVTEFGGAHRFTPAPVPAAECERNCSFAAGHPSVGFALIAFAFLASGRKRRIISASAWGLGALIGVARIAQGGHFLSDVVFAGLLVYGAALLLHWPIIERDVGSIAWQALTKRFGPAPARWMLAAALTFVAIVLSILYLDRPVALYFHGADPSLIAFFRVVTRFGISTYYLIATALMFLALRLAPLVLGASARTRRLSAFAPVPLFIFLSLATSGLLTDLLKTVFGRARPKLFFANETFGFDWWGTQADFWSFPSGHATTIVALAAALTMLWSRFLPFYWIAALTVAMSRIVLGAHYVSDVLIAAFIAIAATAYIRRVLERSGLDLRKAVAGEPGTASLLSWRARLGLRPMPRGEDQ